MAASSTRSKPAKKAASKAKAAKSTSAKGKVSPKAKTTAKATPKKAAAKKVAAAKPAKPVAPARAKISAKAKVAEEPAKKPAPAPAPAPEPVAKAEPKKAAPAAKPEKPPARVKAPEAPAPKPARKPARQETEHEAIDESRLERVPPAAPLAPLPLPDLSGAAQPAGPAPERKKSVLEIAEEDDDFDDEPPPPTLENLHALLQRIQRLAQYGTESEIREELPPLVELLEQIEEPAVLPRLLDLLEDHDPNGVYWNVLYVLEKFDAYLGVLLGGLPALYHRAPEWAYTCVIRILRTRGDEDDCTAAFEQLINAGPADTRALMLTILRELAEHPETDDDQRHNIARTITAIGGDAPVSDKAPEPAPAS